MFDLKLTSAELNDSTAQVSWCVDQETLKYLSDNNIADPQVVIVVAPEGRRYHSSKEYRKVVPLKDLVTYVEFRCAGPNKVWGFISHRKPSDARDYWLGKSGGDFKTSALNSDGSDWAYDMKQDYDDSNRILNASPQPVVVPTDVFAAEPWAWEKTWVNWLMREKAIDQCDFRRRRLFAYTLQPIVMLGNILLRMIFTLVSLLIGARNFSLQYVLHPMTGFDDLPKVCCGGSIFIRHLPEDDLPPYQYKPTPFQMLSYLVRSFWLLPFMPVIFIPLALATYYHVWPLLIISFSVAALATTVMVIVAGFISHYFADTWESFVSIFRTKDDTLWYLNQDEMDLLTCSPEKKPLTYKSLPLRKKTLYLRFQNLKSKVCKPYSA